MAWNCLQIEINTSTRIVQSTIGPGELSRDQAIAVVQALLDRFPPLARAAAQWRAGAEDDLVCFGPVAWTVYEHPDGQDPRFAALVWLHDLATAARAAGAHLYVAAPAQVRGAALVRNVWAAPRANYARRLVAEPPLHGGLTPWHGNPDQSNRTSPRGARRRDGLRRGTPPRSAPETSHPHAPTPPPQRNRRPASSRPRIHQTPRRAPARYDPV